MLFKQGDEGDAAYVMLSGSADVMVDSDGRARSKWRRWLRIRSSARSPSCATCRAPRPCRRPDRWRRLRIRKDHFLRLLKEFPEMTIEIVRVLADRLSQTTAELTDARSNKHDMRTKPRPAMSKAL